MEYYDGDECMRFIENCGIGDEFSLASAVKYLWRLGRKHENPAEDLKKALWYLERVSDECVIYTFPKTIGFHITEKCERLSARYFSEEILDLLRRIQRLAMSIAKGTI